MLRTSSRTQAVKATGRVPRQRHAIRARPASTSTNTPTPNPSIQRLSARLPRFLRPVVAPVLNAPAPHLAAFLILHEVTAVVPLFSLAAAFHHSDWLPAGVAEGAWARQGIDRFGPYLRRRGWAGEGGVRVVLELASAWAVTKALLPVRLGVSVWATPWLARSLVSPVTGWVGKVFGRGRPRAPAAAAPAAARPRVKNEGPLYKGEGTAPVHDAATVSGTAATGGSSAAGNGAAQSGVLPAGVKLDGPLYKNRGAVKGTG